MNVQRIFLALLVTVMLPGLALAQTDSRATFTVDKKFMDGNNITPVTILLSCNTGIPLEQSKTTIPDNDNPKKNNGEFEVEFIVKDFAEGELNCTVSEEVPAGYFETYVCNGEGNCDDGEDSVIDQGNEGEGPCEFTDVTSEHTNGCFIRNRVRPVIVEVTKVWFDEHPEFNNSLYARASWGCDYVGSQNGPTPEPDEPDHSCGYEECGSLKFDGVTDKDDFEILPHWNGKTECDVNERTRDSGVEADDSDCQNLVLTVGGGASCTIENTRFYEGIPTLSQYGLAIMALLMLGLGAVGFRRFI